MISLYKSTEFKLKARFNYISHLIQTSYVWVGILFFLMGTFVYDTFLGGFGMRYIILCTVGMIAVLVVFGNHWQFWLVCVLAFLLGVVRMHIDWKVYDEGVHLLYGREIDEVGEVVRLDGVKPSYHRYVVQFESYGRVLVYVDPYTSLWPGDQVRLSGKLEAPPEFDDFSYREFLRIDRILYIVKPSEFEIVASDGAGPLQNLAQYIKTYATDIFRQNLPEPHASLISGILLGNREAMPEDFETKLKITGTSHIVAVSGFNVSIIVVSLMRFAGVIHRKYLFPTIFLLLIIFLYIVGVQNLPALRAVVVGMVSLVALWIGRKSAATNSLLLAFGIMILYNPVLYKSVSLQLSLFATLGILNFVDTIEYKLKEVPSIVRGELSATLAATIGTLPILVANFGGLSLHSPLVNMIILPFVPIVMLLGFVLILVSLVSQMMASIVAFILWFGLEFIVQTIKLFGSLEFFFWDNLSLDTSWVVLIYLLCGVCALEVRFRNIMSQISTTN